MQEIKEYIRERAREAKAASRSLAKAKTAIKDRALVRMAENLEKRADEIITENMKDLKHGEESGIGSAMLDRLRLDRNRIGEMATGLREVAALPDPVGEITKIWKRPNGMLVGKMRAPIGLIGIIYKADIYYIFFI
ncbi:MAG: gamma-glutamyl-phosphate reductase, partial [Nitrospirota bacterium]